MKQKKISLFRKFRADKEFVPIILWNLFPVLGVLFSGWEPESVFVCYALETVVVGIFNVFRLLTVHYYSSQPKEGDGLIQITSFIVLYGGAVFIQLTVFFWGGGDIGLFKTFSDLLSQPSYNVALATFVLKNALSFINGFVLTGAYATQTIGKQMFEPIPRIIVQQFVVILGGIIFHFSGNGYPVLFVFIALKIFVDLYMRIDEDDIGQLKKIKHRKS